MVEALTRLAILDDYQGVALSMGPWGELPSGIEVTVFRDTLGDVDGLAERLAPYDALVVMRERTRFPRGLIERLPRLRLIVTTGERNLGIDLAACGERGVTVCGTGSSGSPTVGITWGLILALTRGIVGEDRSMRAGGWQTFLGEGLEGRVLGVLGLGKLGRKVAKVGQAFGMRVVAWSQNLTAESAAEVGVERVERDALLGMADVVTLHMVLSERTRGVVGARELGLMRRDAYLVNTSRGPLVDEGALVEALRAGAIAGAGLDVYDVEPLPVGHPLRGLANTVLTPHLGYSTRENYGAYFPGAVECVLGYLAGAPVRELHAG